MKTVRSALWPMLEKARQLVTPEFEALLREELSPLQPHVVAHTLQLWRPLAIEMARTSKTRERQSLMDRYAPEKNPLGTLCAGGMVSSNDSTT